MNEEIKDTMQAKVAVLESIVLQLQPKDRDFGLDLINGFKKKGFLSDKQWYWVDVLISRATGTEQSQVQVNVGDFTPVIELFKKAQKHVKYPKISLQVGAQPLQLSVAGSGSKAPGTVNVTDGRPFGNNIWFGRVTPAGEWKKGYASNEALDAVESFLKKFGAKPAEVAKEYGRLTGKCCFCNSPLTDERSTAAGFGPTCAKHYGLEEEWKQAQAVLAQPTLV